ncbi:MAG: alpha/beta hydrolase [Candidatus Doudnabacteria bacterium]|nr:alpha/beta hydrolase [Candidatus Doudnabacteria bacterium]
MSIEDSGRFDAPKIPTREIIVGGLRAEFLPAEPKLYLETAIFIPGSGLTAKSGLPVLESFGRNGFDSMSVNLKGRLGELPNAEFAGRSMVDFNEDIRRAREDLTQQGLNYNQQVLVGRSAGGLTAMEQAADQKPAALILLTPGLPSQFPMKAPTPEEEAKVQELIARGDMIKRDKASFLSWFGDRVPSDFEAAYDEKYKPMLGFESHQARFEAYSKPPSINPEKIKCPILVVGASDDNRVSPQQCQELARFLRGDYLEMKAGHLLMLESEWPQFSQQITEWLKARLGK